MSKTENMQLKDVLDKASELGGFPAAHYLASIKHMPRTYGQVTAIKHDGLSVDFGGPWEVWFRWGFDQDKRKKYTRDLRWSSKTPEDIEALNETKND